MNKFNYKKLPPFKWFVLENFPFIEADFDAITEWQLLCKLGNEMSKVVAATNTLGTQVETLTDYVSTYFDNLDVQDEVNNKLDEMAESGELTEIIAQYLHLAGILAYNTVSDMVGAENLANGSFAKTYGKLTYNDGLGAFYKIRTLINTDVIDGDNLVALTNYPTLVAEKMTDATINAIIINIGNLSNLETTNKTNLVDAINEVNENTKYISVKNFGVIGNGIIDDTQALQNALNSGIQNIIFEENSIVKITEPLIIPNTIKNIDLNNSKITYSYEQDSENPSFNESCLNSYENNNLRISNGTIEYTGTFDFGTYNGYISGVHTEKCNDLIIENLEVYGFNRAGITIDCYIVNNNDYAKNIIINKCYCHNNRVAGVYFGNTENLTISNCVLEENGKEGDATTGYGLAGNANNLPINTKVLHNITKNNYRKGIDFHSGFNGVIDGNICESDLLFGIYVESTKKLGYWNICNNIIKNMENNSETTGAESASYGIYVGSFDSNNDEAYFDIHNNSILNCNKSNNGNFYCFFISQNIKYSCFKIENNIIDCLNVSRIIQTNNNTMTNKIYDIFVNNNKFKVNSVNYAFIIALPYRTAQFSANEIEITEIYTYSALIQKASGNTVPNYSFIVTNNIANININDNNFVLHNILRVQNEFMKNNVVNAKHYPDWNGYNYDFAGDSLPNYNINWTVGSTMKYATPSTHLMKFCSTGGYGNASVWRDILSI